MRKAAAAAPEGIASIAVDCWSVDYVRLAPDGSLLREPFCYRDERTVATKQKADSIIAPLDLYARTGTHPQRINTVYQLMADPAAEYRLVRAVGHAARVRSLLVERATRS